ncbi:hypothetical protein LPJ59_004834, partial [Coemansia sp. RSA 2399]
MENGPRNTLSAIHRDLGDMRNRELSQMLKQQQRTDSEYTKARAVGKLFNARILASSSKKALIVVLLIAFASSYLMALQGGTLPYIIEHLATIGAELLVSVLSLTAVTVLLYASRMRSGTRRGTLVAVVCIFAALYVYDHGERFEEHGFYNILVFLVIYIPLNVVLATLYVLWMNIHNFPAYFAVATLVFSASICVALHQYRIIFDHGLFGELQYLSNECNWVGPNIPLFDLLPAGTQNFWAGSMH